MKKQLVPDWWNPLKWHWPWHTSSLDDDYNIYAHFAGFGPWQFHWWASSPKLCGSAYNQDLYVSADNDEVECPACRGHGEITSPEKKHWSPCRLCKGKGTVTEQQARDWPDAP